MDASKTFGKTKYKVSEASVVCNAKKVCKTVNSKIIKPDSKSDIDYNNGDIKKEWNLELDLEVHEEEKPYKCYVTDRKISHFCDVQKHILDLDYQCFPVNILMPPQTNINVAPKMSNPSPKKTLTPTIPKSPRILKLIASVKPSTGQFKNNDMDNNSITYKYVRMEVHEGKEQYKCELCNVIFIHLYDVQKHLLDLNFECFLVDNFLMPPLTNMGVEVLQEMEISRQQDYPEAIKTGKD